ncbi:MAG: hypothetical protein IPK74_00820 [Deltaproteobacteria bacterium]|nr:hypothetical protein [Deltaproteobacteria bacterium]
MDEPEVATGPDDEPSPERGTHRRGRPTTPWSRLLLGAAIGMPAMAFGGVHPATVIAFCALVLALWLRLCLRARSGLQIPAWTAVGLLAVLATTLQCLPLAGVRESLAPGLDAMVREALHGTGVQAREGLSPTPADTGLEAARLLALTALFVAAAQLSWRVSAAFVTLLGTAVALVGFAHQAAGLHTIYGWYMPLDIDRAGVPALLGTFVNPNHQSGLLLLGIFSGIAVAADQHAHGLVTADPGRVDRYGDRFLAAMAGVTIQIPALVLSLSRGALVAFLLLAPVAGWLALRRQSAGRRARRRRAERLSPARIMVVAGAVGLFLLVAQHGAWRELATLSSLHDSVGETDHKLDHAVQALRMLSLSPVLGVGRGAFVDLFPSVRADGSYVLATHLECAPAAMLLEWGPWFGGTVLGGLTLWWLVAFVRGGPRSDRNARRVVLLGLLALALQNTVDFSFEFLGVAAPAVALAGALSTGPIRVFGSRRSAVVGGLALAAGLTLAIVSRGHSQLLREDVNSRILAGDEALELAALRARPLDGRLHGLLARRAAKARDYATAVERADVAVRLRPGNVDPWLIRGVALRRLGRVDEGDRSIAEGLARLHERPDEALLAWLLGEYPDPATWATLCPTEPAPWRALVDALATVAPQHADAVAAARARALPDDPEPLRVRHDLALQAGNPTLALHHARLLRQLAPNDVGAHLAVARALRALGRTTEARDALFAALDEDAPRGPGFADLAERGLLEQDLVAVLLELGDADSIARARKLMPELLSRPASRDARRVSEALAVRLDDLR